jgi:hypothetical protein
MISEEDADWILSQLDALGVGVGVEWTEEDEANCPLSKFAQPFDPSKGHIPLPTPTLYQELCESGE